MDQPHPHIYCLIPPDRADELLAPLRATRRRSGAGGARRAPPGVGHRRASSRPSSSATGARRSPSATSPTRCPERFRDEADALRFEQRMQPLGGVHQGTSTEDLVAPSSAATRRRLRAVVADQRARRMRLRARWATSRAARRGPRSSAASSGPGLCRIAPGSRPCRHRAAPRRRRDRLACDRVAPERARRVVAASRVGERAQQPRRARGTASRADGRQARTRRSGADGMRRSAGMARQDSQCPRHTLQAMATEIKKTDAEWREELTPEQYHVLRQAGPSAPSPAVLGLP